MLNDDTGPAGFPGTGSGLHLFVEYAYPPNLRGYCGPADAAALRDYGAAGVVDPGLVELAKSFTGPWPYLTVMAEATGIPDPFDRRLVEAYWVGNEILDRVEISRFGATLEATFKGRAGSKWSFLAETIPAGAVPHHSFHVFTVYPWVGLLTESDRGEPLQILEGCRIRWGKVLSTHGETVVVESRPLTWDGIALGLGEPRPETVRQALDGYRFIEPLEPGELVSLHWDWVCDRLDDRSFGRLQRYTALTLDITNRRVAHSGPAVILG